MNKKNIASIALAAVIIAALALTIIKLARQDEIIMDEKNVTIVSAPQQVEAETPAEFVKKEFVPFIPAGENVALKKNIVAGSYQASFVPRKANDGNPDGASYWEGKPDTYPNTLTVDLEEPTDISSIKIRVCPLSTWGNRTQTFAVNIGDEEDSFTELIAQTKYEFSPDTGNYVYIELPQNIKARYVQLCFTENTGATGGQVAEFEIYSVQTA